MSVIARMQTAIELIGNTILIITGMFSKLELEVRKSELMTKKELVTCA